MNRRILKVKFKGKIKFKGKVNFKRAKAKSFVFRKHLSKYLYITILIILYYIIELLLKPDLINNNINKINKDIVKVSEEEKERKIEELIKNDFSRVFSYKQEIAFENDSLHKLLYKPEYPEEPEAQNYYKNQILNKLSKEKKRNITKIETVLVSQLNNFGNSIIVLNNIIFLCEIMGCNKILLKEGNSNLKWPIKNPIYIKKLNMTIMLGSNIDCNEDTTVCQNFCHFDLFYPMLKPKIRTRYIREEILRNIPIVNIDPDDLYIHIRGGDIFTTYILSSYPQPPLCFYEKIIHNNKFKKIYIISVDRRNPVLDALINKHNNIIYRKNDMKYDISLFVYAFNIVASVSSFTISSIKFNNNLKNLWEYDICRLSQKFLHLHFHLYKFDNKFNVYTMKPSDVYADKMYKWTRSEEQLKLMVEDTCPFDFVKNKQNI